MKNFLLILLLYCYISATGQNKTTENWSLFASVATDYSYRKISSIYDDYKWIIEERNNNEYPLLSYHTGLGLKYMLNEKYSFSFGFLFYNIGWKNKKSDFYNICKYRFISFPLDFEYNFSGSGKQTSFFLLMGMNINTIIDSRYFYIYNESGNEHTDILTNTLETRTFMLGLHASPGITRKIYNKTMFSFNVDLNIFPTSVLNSDINEYLFSIALKLTISRNL
ncbi:MAG: hypothetical protein Kow0068_18270 [Marinilabiliales bacterium]